MLSQINRVRFLLLCLFCLLYAPVEVALANSSAVSCLPVRGYVQHKMLVLNSDMKTSATKLYFIKNVSNKRLWLNHPQGKNPHTGAGWATKLQPGHWSALLLSDKGFTLDCSILGARKVNYLNCSKVIKICQANQLDVVEEPGNYWVVENKSWGEMVKAVLLKFRKE